MPLKSARAKGANYELKIVQLFKELGWPDACSSRSESRRQDDLGIDICYTFPFQIQCKAQERLGSCHDILARMPKGDQIYNVVFHKRNHKGTIVSISEDDFIKLIKLAKRNCLI